ncbi:MAG: hypothetical protein WB019_19040, partial [Pseudolabrys sp.]
AVRSLTASRSRIPIVAKVQTATTETGTSRRDTMPLSERRTNITNNTKNKAANAPAKGAGSTSGVESNPFTDALSVMGIGSGY